MKEKKKLYIAASCVLIVAVLIAGIAFLVNRISSEYSFEKDRMAKYYRVSASDYTGKEIAVDASLQVTDEKVQKRIDEILHENSRAIPNRAIAEGDYVAFYIRATYDGKPYADSDATNYYLKTPAYVTLDGSATAFPDELYRALIGKTPKDYKLSRRFVGTVDNAARTVVMSYVGYYTDGGQRVEYKDAWYAYYRMDDADLPNVVKAAHGETIGEAFSYQEDVEIDGVTRTVEYRAVVYCIVDEEVGFSVDVALADDFYPEDSQYREYNGKTVTFFVVPFGIYEVPVLDENFVMYGVGFETEEEDVVAAYRKYIRAELEDENKNTYYNAIMKYMLENIRPVSYPRALKLETAIPAYVDQLLSNEYLTYYAVAYGYSTPEEYLRGEYLPQNERYDALPIRDALILYRYDLIDEEMLTEYFVQQCGLRATDDEYRAYLQEFSENLIREKEAEEPNAASIYTPDYIENYYKQNYYDGYLRDRLTYSKVCQYLLERNTIVYTAS